MQPRTPKDLWGAAWPAQWDPNLGPDLPADGGPFELEHWTYRWPTGCRRPAELIRGALVFYGPFDHRDVEIAKRTYPSHDVVLTDGFNIEIRPTAS
jgi:hypothetical protein